MRVATRRLRSALRDFMPLMEKRPPKQMRKELKELADALGAARDNDLRQRLIRRRVKKAEGGRLEGLKKSVRSPVRLAAARFGKFQKTIKGSGSQSPSRKA